jgi:phosphoribosyl-ATP pyrophosphohydrolase/phosphoribosyl-AMP cyclohydrolase
MSEQTGLSIKGDAAGQLTPEQLLNTVKYDDAGLVPAVIQDAVSKDVLMVAYMNKESLQRTMQSGETWFWSRSRQELWNKGATSGNTQRLRELRYDCDGDTLLVLVDPQGPACHTGKYSCFYGTVTGTATSSLDFVQTTESESSLSAASDRFKILSTLESVIASREAERPEGAYTTYLFEKGVDKILKKVGEETAEVIIAAKNRDAQELSYEASDLIFHLLVLLREQKVPLDDVLTELASRHLKK